MAQFQAVLQSQPVSALKLTVAEASRQWLSAAKLRVKPSSYAPMKTSFATTLFRISEQSISRI